MSLDLTLKNRELIFKMSNFGKNAVYEFEDFRLDAAHKLLYRDGEQISLTPKAVETLIALVDRRGEVVGKKELMEEIWADTIVEESNLSQYLHVLRKTLGETQDGKPFIETLKRRGYRFNGVARVSVVSNGSSKQARVEEADDFGIENSIVRQSATSDSRSLRVERKGNVLALADWREYEEKADLDNLSNGQTNDGVPPVSNSRSRFRFAFAAASIFVGMILLGAVSFSWFNLANATVNRGAVKNELTFLPLTNAEIIGEATISPDSKYFAYSEYDADTSRVWLQQVGESTRIEIVGTGFGRIRMLTFTRDSTAIYFTGWHSEQNSNSLYRVPTLGGLPTKILTGISGPVSFSPSGDEIVFVRDDSTINQTQIVIAASDGTRERILLTRQDSEIIRPNTAWSPDGKQIAFGLVSLQKSVTSCSIVGIDLAGEAIKPLSTEKWDSCHRAVWTRDGTGLVFIGTKYKEALTTRRDQIYHLALDTGLSRRVTTDGNWHEPLSLGITDTDEILAVPFNRVSQIWSLDIGSDSSTARQITTGQSDGRGGIEVLPNGKIAFLSRTGDGFGIFQANINGAEEREQILGDPTMEELRAAPDGRFVVFAAKTGGYAHLFLADADGANRRQLTFGESNQIDSTVSPDGNWVVYASSFFDGEKSRFPLRKISSDGGDPVQLRAEPCFAPHFSNDGQTISCILGDKISVISAENGETLKTYKTAGTPILNNGARFTPDGRNLVYRVSQKTAGNLWQQPIDGSKPRPLTDFTNGEIYNFAFAPDGSMLYLARGNQIRNAILIQNFR